MSNRRSRARRGAVEPPPRTEAPNEAERLEVGGDDREEFVAPPLPAKQHPAAEMGFVVPTSDDDVRQHPHHPNEGATMEFDVDPEAADAAADLAGDLGAQYLEGATFGEDVSERAIEDTEAEEAELPLLLEEEALDTTAEPEEEEAEPAASGVRARTPAAAARARSAPARPEPRAAEARSASGQRGARAEPAPRPPPRSSKRKR